MSVTIRTSQLAKDIKLIIRYVYNNIAVIKYTPDSNIRLVEHTYSITTLIFPSELKMAEMQGCQEGIEQVVSQ